MVIKKTYSPIDGSVYLERAQASAEQIDAAVSKAVQAQKSWAALALSERKVICAKAVAVFEEKKDVVAQELCWQIGRPIRYAAGEVASFVDRAKTMIGFADEALAPIQVSGKPGFTRFIQRDPLGVVLVIAPWNYPVHTPINSIIPALLAGNTVLLKHSSQTPRCAERIVEAFIEAGIPDGVIQYLHMSHECCEQLIQSPALGAVVFTGSVSGGIAIEKAAAGRFIALGLELGGKDPAYIRSDADINFAVENTVDGAFFNSGQSCCGLERIYVHADIYDDFVEKYIALVQQYKVGRPDDPNTTLGPLIRPAAVEFVTDQIDQAIQAGAKAHIDASLFHLDGLGKAYMAPQVLTQVNHSMSVMTDESFGPVVGIMKVESDEEAVRFMNDSEFGLSAAIFTQDIDKAIQLGHQIETGTFFVNRCDYLDPELAWTGVKNTGRGCSLSIKGFDLFIQYKSFHVRHMN